MIGIEQWKRTTENKLFLVILVVAVFKKNYKGV